MTKNAVEASPNWLWADRHGRLGAITTAAAVLIALTVIPSAVGAGDITSASEPSQIYENAMAAINRGDYVTAARLIRPLADQGDARAQAALGTSYIEGWGVPQNDEEAFRWFSRAADQGDATAQLFLGTLYRVGKGVQQDYVRAYMWYSLAAQSSDLVAVRAGSKARDLLVQYNMNPAQIAAAQKLIGEWKPTNRQQ